MSLNISHCLLVEDNAIIAMDCEEMLRDLGAETVELCSSVQEALTYLSNNAVDFAILDLNLGSETSLPIANQLAKQEIPFLFATGDEDIPDISIPNHEPIVLHKPYSLNTIQDALKNLHSQRV